jgi:hypothetical protein
VPRRGQYRKTTLIERYGPDQNIVDLRMILATDCPRVIADKPSDRCGVVYSDLARSVLVSVRQRARSSVHPDAAPRFRSVRLRLPDKRRQL